MDIFVYTLPQNLPQCALTFHFGNERDGFLQTTYATYNNIITCLSL